MAEYIEYHPLKFWLDPASIAEIVAHIQTYLVNNPINSTTEIETIIHDYLIAHPELIGGVDSVNGLTGEVVLTADNISAGESVTIKDVLDSLQDQIDDIIASIPSDYQQLINDVSDLKSAVSDLDDAVFNKTETAISRTGTASGMTITYSNGQTGSASDDDTSIRWFAVTPGTIVRAKSLNYVVFTDQTGVSHSVKVIKGTDVTTKVPATAVYVYITTGRSDASDKVFAVTYTSKIESIDTQVEKVNNDLKNFKGLAYDVRRDLPSYYTECSDNAVNYTTSEYIEERIAAVPDGKHFIFITDTHWKTRNAKKSTMLIDYVKRRLGIKNVLFGGDILDQESTKYKGVARLKEYMNEQVSAFGDEFIVVPGNHDLNCANYSSAGYELQDVIIPYDQAVKATLSHLDHVANRAYNDYSSFTSDHDDLAALHEYDKMHYYVDDEINGIRYIVVQTGNPHSGVVDDVLETHGNSELFLQMEWYAQTLASTPAGYDIVVAGHWFKGERTDTISDNVKNLFVLAYALKNKTTGTVYVPSTISDELDDFYSKGNHSYDFSTAPTVGRIVFMSGHVHYDWSSIISGARIADFNIASDSTVIGNNILHIVSQCDQHVASTTAAIAELQHAMTVDTVTEQCFDVITIKADKGVVCTRFGAGEDRAFTPS